MPWLQPRAHHRPPCSTTSQGPSWATHIAWAKLWQPTSILLHPSPNHSFSLGHHPESVRVPLFRSTVPTHPIHEPKQSSPNNHKTSTTQQHPILVHCNFSSTFTALHHACQLICNLPLLSFQTNLSSLPLDALNLFSYCNGWKKQNILLSALLKLSLSKTHHVF